VQLGTGRRLGAALILVPALVACAGVTPRVRVGKSEGLLLFDRVPRRHAPGDIYAIRPDGTGLRNLTRSPSDEYDPAWSPDGQKIAFVDGEDVFVMNADGSNRRNLTTNGIVAPGGVSWSPDGRRIAVAGIDGGLYPIGADGSGGRLLLNDPGWATAPAWSPDGTRLVVSANPGLRDSGARLYVLRLSGGPARRLTHSRLIESDPKWSPGGKLIAYAGTDDHHTNIYVIRSDGTSRRRLTHRQVAEGPAWSPDGKRIAFVVDPGFEIGKGEIFVMNADGSGQRRLTTGAQALPTLSWRPLPAAG